MVKPIYRNINTFFDIDVYFGHCTNFSFKVCFYLVWSHHECDVTELRQMGEEAQIRHETALILVQVVKINY